MGIGCCFYEGKLCIMMDPNQPCEVCAIPTIWWAEQKRTLALLDDGEIINPLERKLEQLTPEVMKQKQIEKMTFENTVNWHRENLEKIMRGSLATEVLTYRVQMKLRKYGVLFRGPNGKTRPTPKALAILKESEFMKKGDYE